MAKYRIMEVVNGKFTGMYARPGFPTEPTVWVVATAMCSTSEEAEQELERYIARTKATEEYIVRKAKGEHIIREWEE